MGCRPWRKLGSELSGKSHPIRPCFGRCGHDLSFIKDAFAVWRVRAGTPVMAWGDAESITEWLAASLDNAMTIS
jgi:hypothetical protein